MKTTSTLAMIACFNRDLTYRSVNRAYAGAWGLSPQEIVGRHISAVLGHDVVGLVLPRIDEALQGRCVEFEASIPFSTLGARRIRAIYIPCFDGAGDVDGWTASLTPIDSPGDASQGSAALEP